MQKYLWLVLGLMCHLQASQTQQIIPESLAKNIRACIAKDDVEGLRKLREEEQFPLEEICGNETIWFDYCKAAGSPVTPLLYAASERKLLTTKELITANADINCNIMLNNQRYYPLYLAYVSGLRYAPQLNGVKCGYSLKNREVLKPMTQLFLRDAISKEHLRQVFNCLKYEWIDPERRYKDVTDDLLSLVVNFGKARKLKQLQLPKKAVFAHLLNQGKPSEELAKDIGKEISKYL